MSSETSSSILHGTGALRVTRLGAETPLAIPANGVLQLHEDSGSSVTIGAAGATELVGIEYVDALGNQVVHPNDFADAKFFRAAAGATITIRHNQTVDLNLAPLPTEQRILTSSGKDFVLQTINAQAFFAYAASVTGFRWFFIDWYNFDPVTGADWDPLPATISGALDQLATRAPVVSTSTIAVTSGVPFVAWSTTLAEGEVIGGRVTIVGQAVDTGTTLRSYGFAEFVASRSVGGSAAVTIREEGEIGTIPDGTLATTADGNDIEIGLTYTFTGDVTLGIRVELDRIAP